MPRRGAQGTRGRPGTMSAENVDLDCGAGVQEFASDLEERSWLWDEVVKLRMEADDWIEARERWIRVLDRYRETLRLILDVSDAPRQVTECIHRRHPDMRGNDV